MTMMVWAILFCFGWLVFKLAVMLANAAHEDMLPPHVKRGRDRLAARPPWQGMPYDRPRGR